MKKLLIPLLVLSFLIVPVFSQAKTIASPAQVQQLITQLLALIQQLRQQLAVLQNQQGQTLPSPIIPSSQSPSVSVPPAPTANISGLQSAFFSGDTLAQGIISGQPYRLSADNNWLNVASFEFKLINALKQLGYAQLINYYNGHPSGLSFFQRWQRKNGFVTSDTLIREQLELFDYQLYQREQVDNFVAKNYPPYVKFATAPLNEPAREHLAALYANLFNVLPDTIKARLWVPIRSSDTYSRVYTLESFAAFINRYGRPYFGSLFKPNEFKQLTEREVTVLVDSGNYDYLFCGEGYYSGREIGNCASLLSRVPSIVFDIAHVATLAHEFGHGVGEHLLAINGVNESTHQHFGQISFDVRTGNVRRGDDNEFISQYAKTNYAEDFAESFDSYIHSAKIFRQRTAANDALRQKYDFLKTYVFGGQEYNTGSIESYRRWQSQGRSLPSHPNDYMYEDPDWAWDYNYPLLSVR